MFYWYFTGDEVKVIKPKVEVKKTPQVSTGENLYNKTFRISKYRSQEQIKGWITSLVKNWITKKSFEKTAENCKC